MKCNKDSNLFLFLVIVLAVIMVVFSFNVMAITIDFVTPTPSNGTSFPSNYQNYSILSFTSIKNYTLEINNVQTYIPFDNLVSWYSFNNQSIFGENATIVYDLSNNGANLTVQGNPSLILSKFLNTYNLTGQNQSTFSAITGYIGSKQVLKNSQEEFTISVWFNPRDYYNYHGDTSAVINFMHYNAIRWYSNGANQFTCNLNINNGTTGVSTGSVSCLPNTWHHVVLTYKNNSVGGFNISFYVDNVNIGNYSGVGKLTNATENYFQIGKANWAGASNGFNTFSGLIDEIYVFNKSLDSNQIKFLYISNLNKLNNSFYSLVVNDSTNRSGYTINTKLEVCDITNSCNSTNYLTIFKQSFQTTLTALFNSVIGVVNNWFYGANTHVRDLSYGSTFDRNGDGSMDTLANTTWHRQSWLNAKLDNMRGDMYFGTYYSYFLNTGFERTVNITFVAINKSQSECIAIGWDCSLASGGGNFSALFSVSNISHSGLKSLNVSSNQTGTVAFVYKTLTLPANHTYNFSVWIKSNHAITSKFGWNDGAVQMCGKTSSGSGNWELISCNFTSNGSYSTGRWDINADYNEQFLIDDASSYVDGNLSNFFNKVSLENQTELVQWAYNNNVSVWYIADTPTAFVGTSCKSYFHGWCNGTIEYDEVYTPMIIDFLRKVTSNKLYSTAVKVEIMNEPYGYSNWLSNITRDNITGAIEYARAYNASYTAIKNFDPYIEVGGPSGGSYTVQSPNLLSTFISNFTGRYDFISFHPYASDYIQSDALKERIDYVLSLCTTYSANCSKLVLGEWNSQGSLLNTSNRVNELAVSTANGYKSILNNYPNIIVSQIYQWSEKYNLSYASYPDGGQVYAMISEPNMDNFIHSQYNVTYGFSRYAPIRSTIYNVTKGYEYIEGVASIVSSKHNLIIFNKENDINNVSVTCSGYSGKLIDTRSGTVYDCLLGSFNYGVMNAYDVVYLTEPTFSYSTTYDSWVAYNYLGEEISFLTDEEASQAGLDGSIEPGCRTMVDSVSGWIALIGLIGTVFFLGLAVTAVMGYASFKNGNGLSWEVVGSGFLTMVALGMLIIVAIVFFSNLCF
jgi:hypothetical protein